MTLNFIMLPRMSLKAATDQCAAVWESMHYQKFTIVKIHGVGNMDICAKSHGESSNSFWHISAWTKVAHRLTDILIGHVAKNYQKFQNEKCPKEILNSVVSIFKSPHFLSFSSAISGIVLCFFGCNMETISFHFPGPRISLANEHKTFLFIFILQVKWE